MREVLCPEQDLRPAGCDVEPGVGYRREQIRRNVQSVPEGPFLLAPEGREAAGQARAMEKKGYPTKKEEQEEGPATRELGFLKETESLWGPNPSVHGREARVHPGRGPGPGPGFSSSIVGDTIAYGEEDASEGF